MMKNMPIIMTSTKRKKANRTKRAITKSIKNTKKVERKERERRDITIKKKKVRLIDTIIYSLESNAKCACNPTDFDWLHFFLAFSNFFAGHKGEKKHESHHDHKEKKEKKGETEHHKKWCHKKGH